MVERDYLIRHSNTQKIFVSENDIDVVDTLKTYYGYIYDSINDEGFILKYGQCNLFKELICDKKVVGFCSYDHSREFMTAALSNIYILPEFRGNGIFLKELEKTMAEHNKPSIMEPTRLIVEILIKYGFAKKINENIVASAIEFVIPPDHVITNSDYENEELSTHFYDLDMCASIHVLDINKGHIAYSSPLNYDIIHYDCLDKRNNICDEYFTRITSMFAENDVELMNVLLDLEERLPIKDYTLEEVIGEGDNFSSYIESLLDDAHVTYAKALDIRQQIKEEYEAGMILNESLLIRLAYLFEEDTEPSLKAHDDVCPYCSMPIDDHDRYCHYCGINLDYDPSEMESSLIETITQAKTAFNEDIRFIAYKFLRLIEEKIELEYSVWTIANTYDITWHDLKSFLDKNNYLNENEITKDGHEFLNTHPLHFWEKYHMVVVNYTDFERYFYDHDDEDCLEICLNYLNQFRNDDYILEIINRIKEDIP